MWLSTVKFYLAVKSSFNLSLQSGGVHGMDVRMSGCTESGQTSCLGSSGG